MTLKNIIIFGKCLNGKIEIQAIKTKFNPIAECII